MSATNTFISQIRERENRAKVNQEEKLSQHEFNLQNEKTRHTNRLQMELENLIKQRETLVNSLNLIPVGIQNRMRSSIQDNFKQLATEYNDCRLQQDKFNTFLLKLGSPRFASLALAMTFTVGLFWVWSTQGLDAVGGNTGLTIGIATIALLAIDAIGYFAIFGVLNSVCGFFKNLHNYRRFLEIILFSGSLLALISFIGNLITRLMETGI